MKIAGARIENKGLISNEAIFMHSGEPKAHDIFARNDKLQIVSASLVQHLWPEGLNMGSNGKKKTAKDSPKGGSANMHPDPTLEKNAPDIPVGVVGLGLMGTSIIACLLAAGHPVVGVTCSLLRRRNTRRRLLDLLHGMKREKLLSRAPGKIVKNLRLSEDYSALSNCLVVIESVAEQLAIKQEVFRKIEAVVPPEAIIGSNTSAIPVTTLQKGAAHPERFLGIHWGEPATLCASWKLSAEIKQTFALPSA